MRRMLLILVSAAALSACKPCKCANRFCIYKLDGGGCGYSNANCSSGEATCFTAMGATEGPVADAGSKCVYTPDKDPVCTE